MHAKEGGGHRMDRRIAAHRRRLAGASLLEVLVAILVLSFGLLALAGLTGASLLYNKMAQFRAIGLDLAGDYTDRMRANIPGFQASAYDRTEAYDGAAAARAVPACAAPGQCTAGEIAQIDQAEWHNQLRARLPGGGAFVRRSMGNPLAVDLWIFWRDPDLRFGTASTLAVGSSDECPEDAVSGVGDVPRCMYFRISI